MEQAWKRSGYQVIPNELKDLMMALQSGMVNAFYLPALVAASGQYFALAPNLASVKVAPLYGGIVLSNKVWKRIPDNIKPELLSAGKKLSKRLYLETKKLEKEAIKTMVKNGLKINKIDKNTMEQWYSEADKTVKYLIGKSFSRDIYDKIKIYLNEFRKKNAD
jgi:TRAP-type C4-dicarboxylate transport system substrate-binding protein